jgi:hypothetical protein
VFAPPFSISEADMDEWVIRLGLALDATLADVSHEMA